MRVMKRKVKVFEDHDDLILEDYIKNIYNDVKHPHRSITIMRVDSKR